MKTYFKIELSFILFHRIVNETLCGLGTIVFYVPFLKKKNEFFLSFSLLQAALS